jgi:hypothetical protein
MTDDLPKPSRERSERSKVEPRPVEDIASEAIADIDASLEKLQEWGVTTPKKGRLSKAKAVLERAAKTGEIVPPQRGDDLGLRALEIAFDYAAIADTLPQKKTSLIRSELELSLAGGPQTPREGEAVATAPEPIHSARRFRQGRSLTTASAGRLEARIKDSRSHS